MQQVLKSQNLSNFSIELTCGMLNASTTQHLVSTYAVPWKAASFDDSGTYIKRVTVLGISHWGNASVGYLIKGMSGVRMPAELEQGSSNRF